MMRTTIVIAGLVAGLAVGGCKQGDEKKGVARDAAPAAPTGPPGKGRYLIGGARELWGYIDDRGNVVIKPQFAGANDFSEGLAYVKVDPGENGWGFIDETGTVVIAPQFDLGGGWGEFHDGVARVSHSRNNMSIDNVVIDKTGKKLFVVPEYTSVYRFSEGLAATNHQPRLVDGVIVGGVCNFIDKAGKTLLPKDVNLTGEFANGLAPVQIEFGAKWGFVDITGKQVIEAKFAAAHSFSDGLAWVALGGDDYLHLSKIAFIDPSGKVVIPGPFGPNSHDFHDGVARVEVGEEQWQFIDKTGKVLAEGDPGSRDYLSEARMGDCDFSDGFCLVSGGALPPVYIDHARKALTLAHPFATGDQGQAHPFHDGLARVDVGPDDAFKTWYFDTKGKVVYKPTP